MKKIERPYLEILILCVACAVIVMFHAGSSIRTDKDSVTVVYGKKDVPMATASGTILGISADGLVREHDNIDLSKTGTYEAVYQLKLLGVPLSKKTVPVTVVDMDAPVLEMEDGVICFSKVNEPWTYPAYKVTDNYDKPEDILLSVEGDADSTKEGTYSAKLKACDTSGNCVMRDMTVVVGAASDSDFLPENFDLYSLDEGHVLLEPDSEHAKEEGFEELYWMGDSNILNLGMYDGIPSNRVLARYAMAPETFDKPLHYQNLQQSWNAVEAMKLLKPKRLILMMGEAEAGSGNPLQFAEDYEACVDQLLEANPGMKLYISAILPIREKDSEAAATQEQINRANYCLLEMCRKKKIPMICADAWLKDSSGYGIESYYLEDGFHLHAAHFPAYTDYVRQCITR
ncbi:MAG: hypothetical protein IKE28_12120 [Solobacterium sp.]|nr:hypothetical protein [Solobacterium sp.]